VENVITQDLGFIEVNRLRCFVNCWHKNENESLEMWQKYASYGKRFIIQSTVNKLRSLIPSSPQYIIKDVKYANGEIEASDDNTWIQYYLEKKTNRSF